MDCFCKVARSFSADRVWCRISDGAKFLVLCEHYTPVEPQTCKGSRATIWADRNNTRYVLL
jgi:hypothetical protein